MRKVSLLLTLLFVFATHAFAQNTGTDMADTMRSNGKIYVVVLVLATIFAGLIAYLIRLDVKMSRVEKQMK
jgi:hypothetical protein